MILGSYMVRSHFGSSNFGSSHLKAYAWGLVFCAYAIPKEPGNKGEAWSCQSIHRRPQGGSSWRRGVIWSNGYKDVQAGTGGGGLRQGGEVSPVFFFSPSSGLRLFLVLNGTDNRVTHTHTSGPGLREVWTEGSVFSEPTASRTRCPVPSWLARAGSLWPRDALCVCVCDPIVGAN